MESPTLRLVDLLAVDSILARVAPARSVILTSEERARTRFRATLSDRTSVQVLLPRGSVLRPGTRLVAETGEVIEVVAASEPVYRVGAGPGHPDPAFAVLRAAYHLGNRHVPVELGPDGLKLERDPVLRDLLLGLGMTVTPSFEPFSPEPGAYGGGHRHDGDADGGATGEALSRSAHAALPTGARR